MIKKIANKIIRIILYIINKSKFGKICISDNISKPLFISGKKSIYLDSNIFIRHGARIECIAKWKKQSFSPKLEIGRNTSFEQDLHLICSNHVKIGKDCVFSARVFISDLNHEYKDITCNVMQQPLVIKDIEIGDGCFVGYGACVLPGVHLGKHCIVGANSVVTKSFPDYCVLAGNPAKLIKKYNIETKIWEKVE